MPPLALGKSMQPTDVYSVVFGDGERGSVQQGQAVNGRARLKALYMQGVANYNTYADGLIQIRNGTSVSGDALLKLMLPEGSGYCCNKYFKIPGNGILFDSGIFCDIEENVGSITLVVQGGASA